MDLKSIKTEIIFYFEQPKKQMKKNMKKDVEMLILLNFNNDIALFSSLSFITVDALNLKKK